jgi:hypothetical protein
MTIASCPSVLREDNTTEAIHEKALTILRAGLQARDGEAQCVIAIHTVVDHSGIGCHEHLHGAPGRCRRVRAGPEA